MYPIELMTLYAAVSTLSVLAHYAYSKVKV